MSHESQTDTSRSRSPKNATVAIHLEHGRERHLGWFAFSLAAGLVLLFFLGAVGKVIGALLVIMAAANLVSALRTLRNEPGTIRVAAEHIELPDGLCSNRIEEIPLSEVESAYTLRRALPIGRSGPLLVIETHRGGFAYPRDWFGSESDQSRVEMAIHRRLGSS